MMNLERLNELIQSDPNNLEIHYTNVNGRERLIVNGEDLITEDFDDSEVKKLISEYKDNLELLNDCIFVETLEEVSETIDIKALDKILKKDHFTKDEADNIINYIGYINSVIHEKLLAHIQSSIDLLEKF